MANTIEYADSPNVDTAFVVQEGGQKNRVVLTAQQDTSTLELPDNPNSTKGYVTVDGKKHKVVLTADISGNGGGGSGAVESVNGKTGVVVLSAEDVDAVPQYETMPTASADNLGKIAQFVGLTAGSYTNGYFYQSIIATNVLSGTVEFNPASISGVTATCSGDNFAQFVGNNGYGNVTDIIKGTLTYDQSGDLLVFVGLDDTDTQVCTFQLYTQDYVDAGFTFSGTLSDGDVIAYTTTITATPVYDWSRIDVQPTPVIPDPLPDQTGNNGKFLSTNGTTASWETVGGLPSQTGNAGKFLTTDGTDASWSDKPLVNNTTNYLSLAIGDGTLAYGNTVSIGDSAKGGGQCVAIGRESWAATNSDSAVAIGAGAKSKVGGVAIGREAGYTNCGDYAIGIGMRANAAGVHSIQIGAVDINGATNSDANTFKVANANGNFEIMDANGNLPADRLASITGLADGNYRPRLTISSGVATITWVAE